MLPSKSGLWFLAVGATASLTHMAVFAGLRDLVWAELANAFGFVVAFGVSFTGHRLLSFQDTSLQLRQSLMRFAGTALAGFVCNEAVFVLFHRFLAWPDWLSLVIALAVAAVQTFVLSRFWAFKR